MTAINAVTELEIDGEIATVRIDSPPVNALSANVRDGIKRGLEAAEANGAVKAIVLICAGRTFIAGADISEFGKPPRPPTLPDVLDAIENASKPVVAAIHGTALGGGFEVALTAHYRIAVPSAKMGLPEIKLGLIPGAGGTQRLTRLCGRSVASRLILGAEIVDGADAVRLGIAQWAVARAELPTRAGEIARRIAGLPAPALRASKKCIAAAEEPGDRGYLGELAETRRLSTDAETRERVAAFLAGH